MKRPLTFKAADRLLVFAPHPDDETLATGELIQLARESGASVRVVFGTDGDNNVRLGVPTLSGAKVTGEIVKHGLGEKIVVFKFKRRKNYARKQGHRQKFTEVRIKDITLG